MIGTIHRVDELGRVVIPKAIRRELLIGENDRFNVYADGSRIIFEKIPAAFTITNNVAELRCNVMNSALAIGCERAKEIEGYINAIENLISD